MAVATASIARVNPPGRVAVVGAGAFGRFCIDAYQRSEDIRVVVVADPDENALAQVGAPGVRLVQDWREVLVEDEVEVIHVATPPFQRSETVNAYLDIGKSVLCEKPLALTLEDADRMIATAERAGSALGVDYVMRHHPAYELLERFAGSGLFGALRTISFENYAQEVPASHWFWDREKSGGILVEHGVHFFDAYARIAGCAHKVWGTQSRLESVDVTVRYQSGAIGRFYHEFAFPLKVEHASGVSAFQRGYVQIDGWIPIRLMASVLADADQVMAAFALPLENTLTVIDGVATFELLYTDRRQAYQSGVASCMRDVLHCHRDRRYQMKVSTSDARESLALALSARDAVDHSCVTEISPGQFDLMPS